MPDHQFSPKCAGPVGLYRFFNMLAGKNGEAFALCALHAREQPIPASCILRQIASGSLVPCTRRSQEADEPQPLRVEKRLVTIFAPGVQASFFNGLYAEELVFPDGIPEPCRIEVAVDPATRTILLFTKRGPQ